MAGDEIQVTVTFSETVEVTGRPRVSLEIGGGSRTVAYEGGTGTAALVFAYEVAAGDEDSDGVSIEAGRIALNGGTIEDEADNAAALAHEALAAQAGHQVDGVRPALVSGAVDGSSLTLTYGEALDSGSRPEAGDFTVAGGDRARTVTRVAVRGATVVLTLDTGAEHLEAGIRVSYTPGVNPVRDVPGNQAEALSQEPVTNETPDTTAPEVSSLAISSNPGSDRTYAAGDEIEVTVTFSETVEVERTPQLRLRVGTRTRTAGYLRGSGTAALVFGYEVADGDEDSDGVSIEAGRIALNGGMIEDEAENAAELTHEALATQAGHWVDGVRPVLLSAAVEGASLTLTYGVALDGGSRPASGNFTVEVEGSGRSVSGVSIRGSVVTLFLNPAVEHGDTGIRVSYTVPMGVGANPIRDAVGNQARELSNRSVTNTTGAPNTAPEITSPSSIDVPENQLVARRLAARDTDPGDEVTGWALVGGADQSEFSIASDTGELSFRDPPDFEAPGDNQYAVTVEVTTGAGARELTAEQTLTVRVTDEREPPGVPESPTFSGETADSLTVSWSEPENTGPAITDYDVQYGEKGTGGFTDALHEGPGRTLTLSDLEAGTLYQVQVRARNEEGTSDWSDPGEGMTVTPLTVVMASGAEPPVSGPFTVRFSFSEPVTGFSRSDVDSGQDPACRDDQNNPVFCDPGIGTLQTTDDRVFTATVTPWTDRVAHSYTLRLTVPGGTVRSLVGSKPNEEPEEPLEVRVSPPGVEEPISSIGFQASSGSGSVRLSWSRPSDDGGSPIIRYEYRYQAVGEAWSEWENAAAGTRSVTVGNLVNGREYVFEVRAVSALGKGGVETVTATPELRIAPPRPPPAPRPPGNGDGGGLLFPPEAPAGLMAMPGEGTVRLEWSPPESDGGTPILRYEYRFKEVRGEFGEWTPIEDSGAGEVNASGYTVRGLGNGTVYVFEVRAVNPIGAGRASDPAEVTLPVLVVLDFTHFANGDGITSEMVLVSVATHPIRPALYFYDRQGLLVDPASVVDVTMDLEVTESGSLTVRTGMEPLGVLTIATHGRGKLVSGSVAVVSDGPMGGGVRYTVPHAGVTGAGASPPVGDVVFPARRQEGGIRTAASLHNLEEEAVEVSCRLMSGGVALEEIEIPLEANGQSSWFIEDAFPMTDTSDFLGSVRCSAAGGREFTAIAIETDAARGIYTTLPVMEVDRTGGRGGETVLDFAHLANGDWITDLVFVNLSIRPSGPALFPFDSSIQPSRPAIYFHDTEGNPIAPGSVVDLTSGLEVTDDGALTVSAAMKPLGQLTIPTHGRGELVTGSVRVVSEGPIGGMVRFEHSAYGAAGVGPGLPLSEAVFPVWRREGGITAGFALHNLEEEAAEVTCDLMREGGVLDTVSLPLEANGQTSWTIQDAFPMTDTSDFAGAVRCSAGGGLFTALALEMDSGAPLITALPVVPVPEMPSPE